MSGAPTPYEAGRAAHDADGVSYEDNPYPVDSDDAAAWIDGWCDAETEAEDDGAAS